MIFPIDVYDRVANRKKLVGQDKTNFILTLFIFLNVVCFFVLQYLLKTFFNAPMWFIILVQICIFLFVGTLIFRFVIFNEDAKIKEFDNYDNDSFTKFLHFKKDNVHSFDFKNKNVNVFEYSNGSAMATICFKYGSNNNIKANNTRQVLEAIFKRLCDYNMEFRTISKTENFKNSEEFNSFISNMNKIGDKNLAAYILEVTDNIVRTSYDECNTDSLYLVIKTSGSYQIDDLEQMLRSIIHILSENINSFRSVEFLNLEQLTEFYKEFYTVEAIDFSMMRAIDLANDIEENFSKVVYLYSLQSDTGKIYKTNNAKLDKILPVNERRIDQ